VNEEDGVRGGTVAWLRQSSRWLLIPTWWCEAAAVMVAATVWRKMVVSSLLQIGGGLRGDGGGGCHGEGRRGEN